MRGAQLQELNSCRAHRVQSPHLFREKETHASYALLLFREKETHASYALLLLFPFSKFLPLRRKLCQMTVLQSAGPVEVICEFMGGLGQSSFAIENN